MGILHVSYKGPYRCQNPHKYKGNFQKIIYRSLWERRAFVWADTDPQVLEWSSEEIVIPYISPKDGRKHRYFPDMWLKIKASDGTVREMIWEIKPHKEAIQPVPKTRDQVLMESKSSRRKYYLEVIKYGINARKWEAAKLYCEQRGWTFHIITEKHLPRLGKE